MYSNTHQDLLDGFQKSRIISRNFRLKKNQVSTKSLFRKQIREYCMSSTMHGLSYTVNNGYSKMERTFWLIVTITSLGVGILLTYLMLYRYKMSPTIATLETYSFPTWKIPFPAVTLCNVNKVRKSSVQSFIKNLATEQIRESDIESFFKKIPTLITRDNIEFSDVDKVVQENVMKYINGSIDDIMFTVSQPCSELLIRCEWQGKNIECGQIFHSSKSVEGYCCSFNYNSKFNYDESFLGYVGGTGRKDGLTVTMNTNPGDYFSTTDPFYGVKVLVHAHDVFPETSVLMEVVQPGKSVALAINPYHVESEETVRNLKLSQRMCLFPEELSLVTSEKYDYQQCITECRVKTIEATCHCIPFIYPKKINSSLICDLRNALCMYNNAVIFSNLLPNNSDENSYITCSKCLPECSEEIYTLTSSVKNIFYENFSVGPHLRENESQLHVYYQDISSIKYRREAMVTWDTLVASLGGIFGLCLGGSVLSIVELFYHFTFTFFKEIKNSKHRQRKTTPIQFIK